VERSSAGLLYDRTARDFDAAAGALLADEALRKSLGERGRAYVEARYRWPGITRQYLAFLARVFGEGAA
jgi:glycosyltransferase involved in cell wall biosynthesis